MSTPHPVPVAALTGIPKVTVIVPVRNERHNLEGVLAMIEAQTLRPDEVIFADGRSEDGTADWLREAAATRPWLSVLDNSARIVPAALNVALSAARGDLVARMDAHADYLPTYLETVVAFLDSHPHVTGVGGAMATRGRGPWGAAIASTLSRSFGLGGATHRTSMAAGPIPHVFSGCYRRADLVAIGGWDERLDANEDYEADYRMNAAGHAVWLCPEAESVWWVRDSLPGLVTQMRRYGAGKARTLLLHPRSLKPRQLAPPALVLGLTAALAVKPRVGAAAAGTYLAAAGALGAAAAHKDGASPWRGAVVPPVVHLSWGLSLLAALAGAVRQGWKWQPVEGPLRRGQP